MLTCTVTKLEGNVPAKQECLDVLVTSACPDSTNFQTLDANVSIFMDLNVSCNITRLVACIRIHCMCS